MTILGRNSKSTNPEIFDHHLFNAEFMQIKSLKVTPIYTNLSKRDDQSVIDFIDLRLRLIQGKCQFGTELHFGTGLLVPNTEWLKTLPGHIFIFDRKIVCLYLDNNPNPF